jgi:uncharacterized protein (DUF983 family)
MESRSEEFEVENPNKIISFLKGKCPKCGKGKVFKGPTYSKYLNDMNHSCSNCGKDFEIEPGFYYGAMYFSYALNVAIFLTVFVALYVITGGISIPLFMSVFVGLVIGLLPVNFRLSRLLMLYLFGNRNDKGN